MNCELYLERLREKIMALGIKGAVIGLSGGKDSNIVAKLMVDILGEKNVLGVMIPNSAENDPMAIELATWLEINTITCDISYAFQSLMNNISLGLTDVKKQFSEDARINLAPRLRMSVLYAVAQSMGNGWRVIGTTNRSENYIGWLTKWGDGGADFEPIINLTVRELHELGIYIGLPEKFVTRVPVDGLTPKTDEDRFGFTYNQLDDYIESTYNNFKGTCGDKEIDAKIEKMHRISQHKRVPIPTVEY